MARPISAATTTRIFGDKVTLYKRSANDVQYQCSFNVNGKLVRRSTGESDYEKATFAATTLYVSLTKDHKDGTNPLAKSFADVAAIVIKQWRDNGSATKMMYVGVANRWLLPFFGDKNAAKICDEDIIDWYAWCAKEHGKPFSRNYVAIQLMCLRQALMQAVKLGYLTKHQLPDLENKGGAYSRRPSFTLDEYVQLYRFMRKFCRQHPVIDKQDLQELRNYVLILANTGIRPGTETANLRWKHLRFFSRKGVEYLAINVDGKSKHRELVARHSVVRYLRRIALNNAALKEQAQSNPALKGLSVKSLAAEKLDVPVFNLSNKSAQNYIRAAFKVLLQEANLLKDPVSGEDRTLYSLRHFYITMALSRGTSIFTVAKQCGTSVAMIMKHYARFIPELSAEALA